MTKAAAILIAGFLFGGAALAESTDTTLAPPGCYIGTGCDQNGWATQTSADGSLELGLAGIDRFLGAPGEGSNPGSISGNTYYVPYGPGLAPPSNVALWDYEYSINTQANGGSAQLSNYSFVLDVTDLTSGASGSFDPTLPILGDNTMGTWGAQNAENLAFGNPTFNPNALDDYEFDLIATNNTTGQITEDTVFVDVVSPEPSTMSLAALALGSLVLFGRRRRQQVQ